MTPPGPLGTRRPGAPPGRERPVSIVATVTGMPTRQPPEEVRCVEVRADLAGDLDTRRLRENFPGALLYTLRSTAEGGGCDDPAVRRHARLIAAAGRYDYIDLEAERDLHPAVLDLVPPERRVVSWHGPAADLAGLRRRFAAMAAVPACLYRLVPEADTMAQAAVPLRLLRSLGRDDVTAYARGRAWIWTRVLAARFGAAVAFGRQDEDPAGDGEDRDGDPAVRRLLADYPHQLLARAERIYGIIGASTAGSLCPHAHNAAYAALGLPALFLPFSAGELPRSLDELAAGFDDLGLPLRAVAVVQPHKDAAYALAAEATPFSRRVGAASLLVRDPFGDWWADTEAAGVVTTLSRNGVVAARRRIAVIGCGGAGRAAAAGLIHAGAAVTLVNRGVTSGMRAAERLGLPFVPLGEFDPRGYDVLVHATPLKDAMPVPIDALDPATVIFDLTYAAEETVLTAAARAAGHPTIDGREMTLVELSRQFHRMTGQHIPAGMVRAAQREFSRNLVPAAPAG